MSKTISLVFLFIFSCTRANNHNGIRLISQTGRINNLTSGRLQIFAQNLWGTVCEDSFGIDEADVACRQLGFTAPIGYSTAAALGYAPIPDPIWLDDLECPTFATSLRNCRHAGIGINNCDHTQDIIVSCQGSGSLRLTISSTTAPTTLLSYGRLEVYIKGQGWGTVCDDGFSIAAANVACQQMGFSHAITWTNTGQSRIPSTTRNIFLDNVLCRSTDVTLISCLHNGLGRHNCIHSEDVVVYCHAAGNTITPSAPGLFSSFSSLGTVIGGVVGGVSFLLFMCFPLVIWIVAVLCGSSSHRRNRLRNRHRRSTSAAVTSPLTLTHRDSSLSRPRSPMHDDPPPSYEVAVNYPPPAYSAQHPEQVTSPLVTSGQELVESSQQNEHLQSTTVEPLPTQPVQSPDVPPSGAIELIPTYPQLPQSAENQPPQLLNESPPMPIPMPIPTPTPHPPYPITRDESPQPSTYPPILPHQFQLKKQKNGPCTSDPTCPVIQDEAPQTSAYPSLLPPQFQPEQNGPCTSDPTCPLIQDQPSAFPPLLSEQENEPCDND